MPTLDEQISCDRCKREIDGFSVGLVCAGFYDVRAIEGNPWSFLGRTGESRVCNECAEGSPEFGQYLLMSIQE